MTKLISLMIDVYGKNIDGFDEPVLQVDSVAECDIIIENLKAAKTRLKLLEDYEASILNG